MIPIYYFLLTLFFLSGLACVLLTYFDRRYRYAKAVYALLLISLSSMIVTIVISSLYLK